MTFLLSDVAKHNVWLIQSDELVFLGFVSIISGTFGCSLFSFVGKRGLSMRNLDRSVELMFEVLPHYVYWFEKHTQEQYGVCPHEFAPRDV